MSENLARIKQDKLTGGDVSYYLTVLHNEVVVEAEDVIEYFEMSFAAGTVFKSMFRLCKCRQGSGKPGSEKIYEAEKSFYSSKRTVAVTFRRQKALNLFTRILRNAAHFFSKHQFDNHQFLYSKITISDPKRLTPYSFVVKDLIDSLSPTDNEAQVLEGIMTICQMRKSSRFPFVKELEVAQITRIYAQRIENREKAFIKQG